MKKSTLIILALLVFCCGGKKESTSSETKKEDTKTNVEKKEEAKPEMIININNVAMKSKTDVEKVFGKPTKTEAITGKYPCKDGTCEKVFYNGDSYEVFFRDDKAFRISLNNLGKFAFGDQNIEQLGFEKKDPSFKDKDGKFTTRWNNIPGFHEIVSFSQGDGKIDYILIMVTESK